MMVGPHIRAGSPVTRSNIVRTVFASSRRWGLSIAPMKSSTETSVAFVLISAMAPPLMAAIGPAHRVGAVQRRDRRDHHIAGPHIADTLREIMRRVVERGAGRVMGGHPEGNRRPTARLGKIGGDAVLAG